LLRGTGTRGLSGIPFSRELPSGISIIRPLLNTSRKEITAFLKRRKVQFRTDKSNLKDIYLRNKIRLKLVPFIKREFNIDLNDSLSRLSGIISSENDYLEGEAKKYILKNSKKSKNKFEIKNVNILHPAFKVRIIIEVFKILKGQNNELDFTNIELVLNSAGKKVELPGGIFVKEYGKDLVFINAKTDFKEEKELVVPGDTLFGETLLRTEITEKAISFKGNSDAYLDIAKITFPVIVRQRKNGDRFMPFGMKNEKKLQDFFVDLKIREYERNNIPILCDSNGQILWVAGLRIDERLKLGRQTERILHIKLIR